MARWERVVGWSVVGVLSLILLVVVGITILLHSSSFHQYLIGKVEGDASQELNAKVTLGNFNLNLHNLTLDLYDLNVHTTGPDTNTPLLHVDHIGAGVKIVSVLHREWNLSDIQVDHPVVHMYVDKSGKNNLPTLQPSNSNSKTNLFDLKVKRAVVDRGDIYVNDRKTPLDANLLDLEFHSSYDDVEGGRYYGDIGYKQGMIRYGVYEPMQHDLSAKFNATRAGMTLDPVKLAVGKSELVLHANMQNYSEPVVTASYDVSLDTAEFRRVLKNPSVPAGIIHLAGQAHYHGETNRPALDAVSLDGTITSPALAVNEPSVKTQIGGIEGHYAVANGNAELSSFHAHIFGGEITATASIRDLSGAGNGKLHADAKGISAADLKALVNSASLKDVSVSGQLNATADATWSGSMNHLNAATDASLAAVVAKPNSGAAPMPVNAAIHAKYAGDAKAIALRQSYVKTPQTSINLDGTMAQRSALNIQVRSTDLSELDQLASLASTPKPGAPPSQPLGLAGTATFDGQLRGSTTNPQLTGHLAADNLRVHGTSWKQLRTNIAVSPSNAALQNGALVPTSKGQITFNIQVALKNWAYTSSNPIRVAINGNQLSLKEIEQAANQTTPATGTLSLNVNVHGSQLNPIGNGSLSLVNAKIQQEPIQSVNVKFNGTGDVVHANLDVRIPAGETTGNLTYYPKQEGYEAVLRAANLQLGKIQTLKAKNMQIAGALNIDVRGKGTIKDPQLTANLAIPQLQVKGQAVKGITLQANVANQVGTFALNSEVANTYVKANGRVRLTGDFMADASFDTQGIPLQPIFAIYAPAQAPDMTGETELHASVKGPLKRQQDLEAHASIPVLRLSYKQLQIAAVAPIRFDYANHVLTVQPSEIKGTDTDLRFGGRVPLNPGASATLNATGNVNLQLAQMFVEGMESKGQIKFDINSAGNLSNPDVQGKIQIVDADILPADSPLGLDAGNGTLTLTRDRLQIDNFTGTVGGGQVTATGGVIYKPSLQFNLALAAKSVHTLYQNAIRVGADANIALTGNLDSAYLRGGVQLTNLSFAPNFDLTSFVGQVSGGSTVSAPTGGFEQNLHLALNVQSTSQMNLVSQGFSVQGSANLRVVGTADNPVILGRANINGGDVIFNSNRYVLQSGTIEFVNPTQTEPVVNLAVATTIDQYNINIRLHGPATELQTSYNSDPSLPPVDIINLIARGQTTEAAAQNTTPASVSAESAVASTLSSQVTSRVAKIAGISQLSIDPGLGSAGNTGPRIAVQQRVTSNLFVTFATDLTGTQREQIQVEYHITPKWSVSGIRDQNGGFGFDAKAHKEF